MGLQKYRPFRVTVYEGEKIVRFSDKRYPVLGDLVKHSKDEVRKEWYAEVKRINEGSKQVLLDYGDAEVWTHVKDLVSFVAD